jgi:hypothetical protein
MKTSVVIATTLLFVLELAMHAQAKNIQHYIENPQKVGEARLRMWFFDIYDASLIAPNGKFTDQSPFALSLTYLRDFDGIDIASRSIDEMRKLGMKDEMKLAKWYEQMQRIFPNVKDGQTITGLVDKQRFSHFYFEEQELGAIEDTEFSQWFFNIWLSENTSEPKMRKQLLGLKK